MTHEISEQAHVYLPDDLLEEILEGTSSVSSSIREIFERICELEENDLTERVVRVTVRPTPHPSSEIEVACHPRCLDGATEMVVERFKAYCADVQSRSLRPASWWERFWK